MTRCVIVSRIYVPEPAAASFRLRALARAIAEDGGKTLVITSDIPNGLIETGNEPGIRVSRRRVLRDSEGYVRGYLPYMSFDLPAFVRLLAAPRPDVVVCEPPPTTGFFTRIACAIRRIPYVYYVPDIWADAAQTSAPAPVVKVLRWVENWAIGGAAHVVTVSDAVAARLAELGHTHVTVATNGIDTDVFTVEGPTPAGAKEPYFVYAGTASEWQGAEIFAQAMRKVHARRPDAKLLYLGQGSSAEAIDAIARDLPEGVITQLGRVNAQEAAGWQRGAVRALVSIKPGLGYDFAMPTKVYSALAVGTPVVYCGPGPLREPIAGERLGAVVDYDVDEVASAMLDALEAPRDEAERQRRRAWVVESHSLRQTGRTALEGVKRALMSRGGRR
ncbi:glycosyltransferase family 4 protein [Trueperella sp.]|uniref:glycosyltransferase family 4 protein n=1 Tax=Trueperella sp. TaxID=2699835 RepID=UPI0022EB11C7|nr:glycosyltransferase family 4 protein [Trueperella sp.]